MHVEAGRQGALPVVAVVGVEDAGALAGEEAGGHRVVVVGELDDERGAEVGEEGDDLIERDGVRQGEVVDDGQAEDEVGPHAVDEGSALARAPSERRRRVGQVEHERQDALLALGTQIAVEAVDDEVVTVDGDDAAGAGAQGEPGEVAVVGAEVEHARARGHGGGDESLLGLEVGRAVVAAVGVVRPRRRLAAPRQAPDGLLQVLQLGVDDGGAEAGALQLGLEVTLEVGVGVAPLGAGVQLDVGEHALGQVARAAQEVGGDDRRDAVDAAAQERLEGHVAQRLDEQAG